jgi:two-component system phosphate regulon sensor histidine kinase PhoR
MRSNYYDFRVEYLDKAALITGEKAISYINNGDMDGLQEYLSEQSGRFEARFTVVRRSGKVIADTYFNAKAMENHNTRFEIARAFDGEAGRAWRKSATLGRPMIYAARPVYIDNRIPFVIRAGEFETRFSAIFFNFFTVYLVVSGLILVLALIVSLIYTSNVYGKINNLNAAIDEIKNGNFRTKIFFKNPGEFSKISESFNYMSDKLRSLFEGMVSEREELNALISSMQEALWIIDDNDRIVLANEGFKNLVSQSSVERKLYWEVLRNNNIDNSISEIRKDKKSHVAEISFDEKYFLFVGVFLPVRSRILNILYDISEAKQAESFKKNLVASVSHELKTPLTSIKGFIETLKSEESDKEKLRYIEIIERNANRLDNIVKDLLLLSRLEEMGKYLQLETVDLKNVVDNIEVAFEKKLRDKSLYFKTNLDKGVVINGDIFKIEQMFINLVDNAIKYTEKGGILITIRKSYEEVRVVVEDTGVGIAPHHLSKIFERFYVVDKSRSRLLGGTGLGLSIVKHIVNIHKGKIEVESLIGIGTRFIISFPV